MRTPYDFVAYSEDWPDAFAREAGRLSSLLGADGYAAWGEYGLPRRRYFTRERDGRRTHHLHCYSKGDPEIERHLAFAAYLREHDEARREYEAIKKEAFARHPGDIQAYCDFKDAWIKAAERRAIEWRRARVMRAPR